MKARRGVCRRSLGTSVTNFGDARSRISEGKCITGCGGGRVALTAAGSGWAAVCWAVVGFGAGWLRGATWVEYEEVKALANEKDVGVQFDNTAKSPHFSYDDGKE